MKIHNTNSRKNFTSAVRLMLVFVFIYAAFNKLYDLEAFEDQLSLSPMIPEGFYRAVAIVIPLAEVAISLVLCVPRKYKAALYSSYFLLLLFTFYIIFLMRYSTYVPCSCGGILGNLSWKQHVLFNVILLMLSITSCYIAEQESGNLSLQTNRQSNNL